jgi:hypothetical protein
MSMQPISLLKKQGFLFLLPLLLLLMPLVSAAQNATGLWRGTMVADDSTRREYPYEVVITEKKGKLSGYSLILFVEPDSLFYGIKKLSVRRNEETGEIEMEELGMVTSNYGKGHKGVHQVNSLTISGSTESPAMTGTWKTTKSREFKERTGTMRLERMAKSRNSKILPYLEDLRLIAQNYRNEYDNPPVAVVIPSKKAETVVAPKVPTPKPPKEQVIKKQPKPVPEPVAVTPKPIPPKIVAAAQVEKRVTQTIQTLYYQTDSLILELYDNGEVDGDTVSILMNGKMLLPMQGLNIMPVSKAIYINPETDSITLTMYAENLGSIPPNTGLVIIKDGNQRYEIRFSADMQKNAAVVFRRKKQ